MESVTALYFDNPLLFDFQSTIIQKNKTEKGFELILNQSYFYPTGGGQDCDLGTISGIHVLDVFRNEQNQIVHLVANDISTLEVECKIDSKRRISNMQHHSCQHLLSQAVFHLFGFETSSVKIYSDKPSYIDVARNELSDAEIKKIEAFCNELLFKNLKIHSYIVDSTELSKIPLRKENSKYEGKLRIVEIEKFDYSACGGTHCLSTGMLGLFKIVKTERINRDTRIYFICGNLAFDYLSQLLNLSNSVSRLYNCATEDIYRIAKQQSEQNIQYQKDILFLKQKFLPFEAEKLHEAAIQYNSVKWIKVFDKNYQANDLRILANILQKKEKTIGVFISLDNTKLTMIVSCSSDSGFSANDLLKKYLQLFSGKGGGNKDIAQGGGQADESLIQRFLENGLLS